MTSTPWDVTIAAPFELEGLRRYLDDAGSIPRGLGGAAPTRITTTMLERGRRVAIATLSTDVPAGTVVELRGPRLAIRVGAYRGRHRARDAFRVERMAIAAAVRALPARIVHAHWSYEFALGALDARPDAIVTFRDWGPTVLRFHRDLYRAVRLGLQFRTLARAEHLTTVSPYLERHMARWTRTPVRIVPNGLPRSWFGAPRGAPDLHRPTLIAINAGFDGRKNVMTLLRAFPLVRARSPQSRLVLVGPEYGAEGAAATWARRHGLENGVVFHGPAEPPRIGPMLREADVFVHPSREESFGNVLVEAMSQGLPVVGGRSAGAVPWVLDEGRAGVLTDVDDPSALADSILRVCTDEGAWRHYARTGYAHAEESFHLDRVVDAYEDLYAEVAR